MDYTPDATETTVRMRTMEVAGLKIFYREAGRPDNPKLVLLHGFPASSHQYRNLIPALADKFHVVAMDYPGFGNSDMPDPAEYSYTFDQISDVVEAFLRSKDFTHFGLYMQDYGGPVGFRILTRNPDWLQWLIIQNTNAYEVGFTAAWEGFRNALWKNRTPETERPLMAFLELAAIQTVYLHGHKNPELISPDNWNMDFRFMERPHARQVQMELFNDYRTNVTLYPTWQEFLRFQSTQDDHLLGSGRHLLHPRRRRGVPAGLARGRDASAGFRPLRGGRLPGLHRRPHASLL